MKQRKVRDFYWEVFKRFDVSIAEKWLEKMVEWDGSKSVWHAFYDESVLRDRLSEVLE